MNKELNTYTLLEDCKLYARTVTKDNKTYIDLLMVLPNEKDFLILPNYRFYSKFQLGLFRYHVLKAMKPKKP